MRGFSTCNAAIDRFPRRGVADRAVEQFAREVESVTPSPDIELCTCVSRVASTLKSEYAHALKAIATGGTSVKKGLSGSNGGITLRAPQ